MGMTNEELFDELSKHYKSTENEFHAAKEQIIGEVQAVARGHETLGKQIDDVKSELKEDISELRTEVRAGFNHMNKRLDDIESKVKTHDEKLSHM